MSGRRPAIPKMGKLHNNCGWDLVTLAAMLGHSRIQMVLRYAHPTEAHQTEAMMKSELFTATQRDKENAVEKTPVQ
jgi:hypothetical protein